MDNKQKFGLIIPKKEEKRPTKSFLDNLDNDHLSDDENNFDYKKEINKNIARQAAYSKAQLSEQMSINLASDPNFYEYDSVYNESSKSKVISSARNDIDDKPKYLGSILAATEKRTIEQSLIKEKVETKRREREENDYGEKPKYLTKAYKESLNITKKNEMINTLNDKYDEKKTVSSEFGMMGFYSNLLTRNTLYENKSNNEVNKNEDQIKNIQKISDHIAEKRVNENKINNIQIESNEPLPSEEKETLKTQETPKTQDTKDNNINVEDYKKRFLERKRVRNENQ